MPFAFATSLHPTRPGWAPMKGGMFGGLGVPWTNRARGGAHRRSPAGWRALARFAASVHCDSLLPTRMRKRRKIPGVLGSPPGSGMQRTTVVVKSLSVSSGAEDCLLMRAPTRYQTPRTQQTPQLSQAHPLPRNLQELGIRESLVSPTPGISQPSSTWTTFPASSPRPPWHHRNRRVVG